MKLEGVTCAGEVGRLCCGCGKGGSGFGTRRRILIFPVQRANDTVIRACRRRLGTPTHSLPNTHSQTPVALLHTHHGLLAVSQVGAPQGGTGLA